jgi:AraC-like DNA-binding protein
MDWENEASKARYRAILLARGLKTTPRHLQRYLKKTWGKSPKEFLWEFRMRSACRLIKDGIAIKEVAGIVGFKNSTHFSRAFKREFGVNPTEYWRTDSEKNRIYAEENRAIRKRD